MEITTTKRDMLKLLRDGYSGPQLSEEEQHEVTKALCDEGVFWEGCYDESRARKSCHFCDQAWDYLVSEDTMKWYDHDSDMMQLSKQFPDYYILLSGQGEDPEDNWRTVYHNGKIICHQTVCMYFEEVTSLED